MSSEVSRRIEQTVPAPTPRSRATAAQVLAHLALIGAVVTVVIFAALHVLPPTRDISPIHRTISEYALTSSAWAFNLAVIALALSSAAVFAGAVTVRRLGLVSAGSIFGVLWIAGLLTLVGFPKHNWALGPSSSGQIHRMASLVAFLALPIAVILITRHRSGQRNHPTARCAFWLGIASLVWFSPILIAIATSPQAWWQQIPLGLIERAMALTEVLAVVALALLIRASAGTGRGRPQAISGSITSAERTPSH